MDEEEAAPAGADAEEEMEERRMEALGAVAADEEVFRYEAEEGRRLAEERAVEASALRSQCLPLTAFLLHSALDGTARWIEQFEEDAARRYGREKGRKMIRGLVASESVMEGKDDGGEETPLSPEYWHRACLGLAATVADEGNGLMEAFSEEDMEGLMGLMAESAVQLLRCTRG